MSLDFNKLLKKSPVVLAPMAGVTSSSYRKFMEKYPIAFSYSEMVSDLGLVYKDQKTLELLNGRIKKPYGIQIFGSKKENLVKAIKIIESLNIKYDFIDLNCACPVPKVTKNGAGAMLLKDPVALGEIVKAMVLVSKKPITAKIRLGFYDDVLNFKEVIKALVASGVSLIAIHARSAKQLYSGTPRFELLQNLKEICPVPLLISGNMFSKEEAKTALELTKADGILVARGAVGNPDLVKEIFYLIKKHKNVDVPRTFKKQGKLATKFLKLLIKEKGE
ncbi:MAG: tRNA-dihydrouridine synthase family protein, partial [Erysipelotrichaceae bacterium]|nr:tRNA-dihydrouridine synthase family protein [Erysipelotrichaceae bacterium]